MQATTAGDRPPRPENTVPIGAVARALGVSLDTLRRWEARGEITFQRQGSRRVLAASELVRLVRARERSGDARTSARNHLAGVVVAIERDAIVATIELACGPYRVLSLVTSEAVDELGLRVGDEATAVVKAGHVVVERA